MNARHVVGQVAQWGRRCLFVVTRLGGDNLRKKSVEVFLRHLRFLLPLFAQRKELDTVVLQRAFEVGAEAGVGLQRLAQRRLLEEDRLRQDVAGLLHGRRTPTFDVFRREQSASFGGLLFQVMGIGNGFADYEFQDLADDLRLRLVSRCHMSSHFLPG
jgi:hypothetical protein